MPLEDVAFSLPDKGDGLEDMIDKKVLKEMVAECLEKVDMKYREPSILYFLRKDRMRSKRYFARSGKHGRGLSSRQESGENVYDNYGK